MRDGVPGWRLEMPHIVGSDISGEVAQVGSLVKRLKPGHRVLLAPGVSCGQCEMCFNGLDSACRQYSIYGVFIDGGYAEYVKSPESNVLPVPSDLSFDEAAAEELLELIMRRYERASTLVTSNRPVEDWGKLLGDAAAVSAMLHRLLHHGHLLKCGPRSWRTKTDLPAEPAAG